MGLIVADDGRVLLQHRDDRPDVSGAGLWGFFGGRVERGERTSQAFLREMREELSWQPRHFEHYLTDDAPPLPGAKGYGAHVTSHVFAAHLQVPLGALTLGEGQAMALFAVCCRARLSPVPCHLCPLATVNQTAAPKPPARRFSQGARKRKNAGNDGQSKRKETSPPSGPRLLPAVCSLLRGVSAPRRRYRVGHHPCSFTTSSRSAELM